LSRNPSTLRSKKRSAPSPASSDSSDVYVSRALMTLHGVFSLYVRRDVLDHSDAMKRQRRSLPPPGSPEFDALPPVSVSYVHQSLLLSYA
jgi:hypothetical protein